MKKLILKIILAILILMTGTGLFFEFGVRLYYNSEELESYRKQTLEATPFSETFYNIYDKIYQDRLFTIRQVLPNSLLDILKGDRITRNSYDLKAAKNLAKSNNSNIFGLTTLAFYLNRNVGPKQCFDFYMNKNYEYYAKIVKSNLTVQDLQDSIEILRFFVMRKGPSVYNNKQIRINEEVDKVKLKLN